MKWPANIFGRIACVIVGLVALTLITSMVSCVKSGPALRQGWNKSYGPVVPHDTFPADCSLCHAGGNWTTIKKDFTFDHAAQTGTPLNGAHAKVTCLLCHNDRGPVANFAAKGCAGCHVDTHRGRLGATCADCHDEQTWKPVQIIAKHNRTRFALIGAHAATACYRCHAGAQTGNFEGADTRCATCHQADLARATSPNHVAQGWTDNCQKCHTPIGWKPARFNHPAAFPLVGGHGGVACTQCHTNGQFTQLPTDCASCHMTDYQNTTDPNHAAAGFSTNCASCHTINSWQGAKFNHPASFPLTGGHAGRACADCHKGGVYTGLSTDCVSCHLSNYQSTTNPNHAAAGFSTACASCHTTTTWAGATFNHTQFPITSGPHHVACNQCHTNPSSYASFNCTNCHTQAVTNSHHTGVSGYTWSSPACYQCHPNGQAG